MDSEDRIERNPRRRRGLCLAHLAEMRQSRSEKEVRKRKISVSFDGPAEPSGGLLVAAKIELCSTRDEHPSVGCRITRAKAQGLKDMTFGFLGPPGEEFGHP